MPTRMQICPNCNLHYIDEAKHQRQCTAVPRIRSVEQLCEFCGTRYDLAEGHDCDIKQAPPAAPAIIIARKHQSAPKEHWADKEMRLAAQEIVDGKVKISDQPEEFWDYGQTQTVAEHPRVKEALARLEKEMEAPANTQELLEKTAMYHELNERASQPNQWDGQGRWMGDENEEMRKGTLLSPHEFMRKLEKVIGPGRIELNRFAVLNRVAILAPDPDADKKPTPVSQPTKQDYQLELLRKLEAAMSATIDMRKQLRVLEESIMAQELVRRDQPAYLRGKMQVATLQWPIGTEWMVMRFDDYGVPTTAKYLGWRTALLSLITLGIVSEKEAHKAFPIGSGLAANWYREQLQMLRQKGALPA
jgi:hypothetical protein